MQRRGVFHLGSGRRRAKLGVGIDSGDKKHSGGKAQQEPGPHSESGKTMGKDEKTSHSDWTAPST
jgi:hypothetical protein